MDDNDAKYTTKNRFIRFNPVISSGHILTAVSVLCASLIAWAQLRADVNVLLAENTARKAEIVQVSTETRIAVKEMQVALVGWFDRLDDKIERKKDK